MSEPPNAAELAKIIDFRVARRIRERRLSISMTQQKLAQTIAVVFQQAYTLGAPITYFFTADDDTGNDDRPATEAPTAVAR